MILRKYALFLAILGLTSYMWAQDAANAPTPVPPVPADVSEADVADTDDTSEATPDDAAPDDEGEAESEEEDSMPEEVPNLPDEVPFEAATLDFGESETGGDAIITKDEETISVEFPDDEIKTIIRNVADLYELNVVIPDTLQGRISLKLKNVTWRQVFDVALAEAQPEPYTYVEDRNIIKIKGQSAILLEPVMTRVIVIDYATAAEMSSAVSPLVDTSNGGKIQVDSRSNSLIITERAQTFNQIQAILERLDQPNHQVMIESKFIEVTDRDVENIGIDWSSLIGYGTAAGPFQREYLRSDVDTNTKTRDTNLEADTTNTTRNTSGNDNGVSDFSSDLTTDVNAVSEVGRQGLLQNVTQQSRIDTAVFSADTFQVILAALKTNSDVELISNPTVVTLNNTPAQINIGEEFPIPEYTYNDERGTFEVSGFTFKPIGILLDVVPSVNEAGFINLVITPEVSSRTGVVNFGGTAAAEIPIIGVRKTSSTISIKDGFTLAIGGLIERTTNNTMKKVPFLGNLPGLGKFFRHENNQEDRRNLLIFITAKTLNPDGSDYTDIVDPRVISRMGITPSDLPGYEAPEAEQKLYEEIRNSTKRRKEMEVQLELKRQLESLKFLEDAVKAELEGPPPAEEGEAGDSGDVIEFDEAAGDVGESGDSGEAVVDVVEPVAPPASVPDSISEESAPAEDHSTGDSKGKKLDW